jgi:hypothetical protein
VQSFPSKQLQGCGRRTFFPFRTSVNPSEVSRDTASLACSSTSANNTPLQQRPQFGQSCDTALLGSGMGDVIAPNIHQGARRIMLVASEPRSHSCLSRCPATPAESTAQGSLRASRVRQSPRRIHANAPERATCGDEQGLEILTSKSAVRDFVFRDRHEIQQPAFR